MFALIVLVKTEVLFSGEIVKGKIVGLNRDLNPGPLAPKARIIPLDH